MKNLNVYAQFTTNKIAHLVLKHKMLINSLTIYVV